MAAAVLRPIGSIKTRLRVPVGSCFLAATACSAFVTVQMRSGEINGRKRATVCSSMVSLPTMFSNCFGVRVRLRGQKRVPRPPARMTAWVVSFSVGIGEMKEFNTERAEDTENTRGCSRCQDFQALCHLSPEPYRGEVLHENGLSDCRGGDAGVVEVSG